MKVYTKKVLRKALDNVFDQYPGGILSGLLLSSLMSQRLDVSPENYSRSMEEIQSYINRKVEHDYLVKLINKGGGYRRVSDMTPKELAAVKKERELVAKGVEIKTCIIKALKDQIEAVRLKSARSFVTC